MLDQLLTMQSIMPSSPLPSPPSSIQPMEYLPYQAPSSGYFPRNPSKEVHIEHWQSSDTESLVGYEEVNVDRAISEANIALN